MHIEPYKPVPKQVRRVFRWLAIGGAIGCSGVAVLLFACLMVWVSRAVPETMPTAALTHLIGTWILILILGTLVAILCLWVPAHDELARRKNEPHYEGVHVRQSVLIRRIVSALLLRATPPPRILHR